MTQLPSDATAQLRRGIYLLLIALTVGNMTGRLLAVNSVNRAEREKQLIAQELKEIRKTLKQQGLSDEQIQARLAEERVRVSSELQLQRPFLSANDRSRWLAVRALVEQGTFAIDGVVDRRLWDTIDMVQHQGRDGQLHLYSSKPPLLMTLIAAEYWVIYNLTGMSLATHPYVVGRLMLVTINILPMVLMLALVARLVEKLGSTDWGKVFTVASAAFGTMLLPFAVVLNNHLIAAVSASVALYSLVRIKYDGETRVRYFALVGIAGAFTAANELPALAFLAWLALMLWGVDRRAWLIGFLPAAAIVAVAFFATNYAAHESLRPPYMHRSETNPEDNWYDYSFTVEGVTRQSYWNDRQGIDRGEPSRAVYALHVLVGHHGIFSLTPIWLLSMCGLMMWMRQPEPCRRQLAWGIAALTVVCLVFYIGFRPQHDRNYGGMTSGFRWMFWFAPLWLIAMLPAVDRSAKSSVRKAFVLTLLAVSVLSASYPTWNPWTHPWITHWLEFCGW